MPYDTYGGKWYRQSPYGGKSYNNIVRNGRFKDWIRSPNSSAKQKARSALIIILYILAALIPVTIFILGIIFIPPIVWLVFAIAAVTSTIITFLVWAVRPDKVK